MTLGTSNWAQAPTACSRQPSTMQITARCLLLSFAVHTPAEHACCCVVDDEYGRFICDQRLTFTHPYPATKIMFLPSKETHHPDLMATTGDYLRIWLVQEEGVILQKLLNNVRQGQSASSTGPAWGLLDVPHS